MPFRTFHVKTITLPQTLFLAFLVLTVGFDLVVVAFHSPLGTDELMARISAQSSSLGQMLTLLRAQPVNVDALVFPILAFFAAHLPLPIDLAIRVPSMVAMMVAVLASFFLIRDHLGTEVAYLGVVMLTLTSYTDYGAKARPYALLLGGLAVTMLCWSRVTIQEGRRRRWWLAALCCSATAALLTHYFAVFSIFALVLAEVFRTIQIRKIDWPIWLALALSALIFLPVYAAYALGGQPYRAHPFDHVRLSDLIATYKELLKWRQLLLVFAIAVIFAAAFARPKVFKRLPASHFILASALSLGPLLIFVAGRLYSHTYAMRYGISGLLGVAVLMAAAPCFLGWAGRALVPGLLVVFLIHQVQFVRLAREPRYAASSVWPAQEPETLSRNVALPLMTPDFDYAMRIKFYAPRWLSSRLVMVGSRESMLKFMGTDAPTLAMLAIHRWTGWPMTSYSDFVRDNKRFLMYGDYWALEALKAEGADIQQQEDVGPYHLYLVSIP